MIEQICQLSRDAGAAIMTIYQEETQIDVQIKKDNSPVTNADLAAHNIICRGLMRLTPDIPVLSEEDPCPWSERQHWQQYWLVDPLDGTKEFIKRNGEFTVNIALIDNGRPIMGVIYAPVFDRLYAADGDVVWKEELGERTTIAVKTSDRLTVATTRSHTNGKLAEYLEQLPPHEKLIAGSSLKFCLIAEGKAQLYPRLGPTSIWDTAAGQAIVETAGGSVTDWQGNPISYFPAPSLLNPEFIVTATKLRR
jgi:3'(2'), 5'-bisphosphate nucleotidase